MGNGPDFADELVHFLDFLAVLFKDVRYLRDVLAELALGDTCGKLVGNLEDLLFEVDPRVFPLFFFVVRERTECATYVQLFIWNLLVIEQGNLLSAGKLYKLLIYFALQTFECLFVHFFAEQAKYQLETVMATTCPVSCETS